ncbi:RDD family protein [Micrococcus sp.]|uniref:RDD family protein n=1 Tax=Micrococcus sp. TaxID=1271 RepID=UPI002A90FEB6|nr:RDD family protein [Micrococcus sp.]MDY6055540.1 RDD family protein [Micrococcus sp.]
MARRAPDPRQDRPRRRREDDDGPAPERPAPTGTASSGTAPTGEPLITRRDLAGWVDGPGGGRAGGRWPGDLLGLPQHGPSSLATAARRILALCLDWALALGISAAAFGSDPIATLLVFAAMHVIGISLVATTVGKAVCRTQVVQLGGRQAPPWRVLVRTALLCLVLPAVVVDPDGRGMHDRIAGTVELRM